MIDQEKERLAFESKITAEYPYIDLIRDADCGYTSTFTHAMWKGWIARANQQPSAQWIAVTERLPGDAEVLAYSGQQGGFHVVLHRPGQIGREYQWDADYYGVEGVTHWQPLPQSPDTMRKG